MLDQKIALTDRLINHIHENRIENSIDASGLSVKIGRPNGFISALENKRIKKIASTELIEIFKVIYNVSEDEAIVIIESLINSKKEVADNKQDKNYSFEDIDIPENDVPTKIIRYNLDEDYDNPDLIKGMLNELVKRFSACYKIHPKDTVWTLNMLLLSMQRNLSFVMSILTIPYFRLAPLTEEERMNAFNDMAKAFKHHLEIAKSKKEESR